MRWWPPPARWTDREMQICAMEYAFIGGSMGSVVGEKIARAIERCHEQAAAADHGFRIGRRAHAGRRHQLNADGQDFRRR